MPLWGWFFIAALVVVAALGIALAIAGIGRRKTRRLKERFGPEYDHTVSHVGEQRAAEKEANSTSLLCRPRRGKTTLPAGIRCRRRSSIIQQARYATRTGLCPR
jgi:hypothetical protein